MAERKIILYIASSIDGFIARENGAVDWLSTPELMKSDYGYKEFDQSIDTVLMGHRTYEHALRLAEQPFSDGKRYCVFTRQHAHETFDGAEPITLDAPAFVDQLKSQPGKHVWLMGGGQLVRTFLEFDLIDELMLFVIPVILSSGIRLFVDPIPETKVRLLDTKKYDTGVILAHYSFV